MSNVARSGAALTLTFLWFAMLLGSALFGRSEARPALLAAGGLPPSVAIYEASLILSLCSLIFVATLALAA